MFPTKKVEHCQGIRYPTRQSRSYMAAYSVTKVLIENLASKVASEDAAERCLTTFADDNGSAPMQA